MKKLNIDVVDDCAVVSSIIKFELQKRDHFNVRTFASGEDYLKSKQDSDFIVVDHHMSAMGPEFMDGLEMLEKMKNRANAPVIYLSGQSDIRTVVQAMKIGASDYLSKDKAGFVHTLGYKVDQLIAEELQYPETSSGSIVSRVNILAATSILAGLIIIFCV